MEKAKVEICVTTEKDLVKVKQLWGNSNSVLGLSLGIKFLEGQDELEKQLARV
jgi:tetraacyldisaccharide-1-P 4'-kinase